jgi:hypothetical protein
MPAPNQGCPDKVCGGQAAHRSSDRAILRDPDSTPDHPVFNRTVSLRDAFAKEVGGKG